MSGDYTEDDPLREWFGPDYLEREKAAKLTESERRKLVSAMRDTFGTDAGKRLLCWIIAEAHIYRPSFTGNSQTFFLEGERQVGLKVLGLLMEANPDAMQQLVDFKRKAGIEDE